MTTVFVGVEDELSEAVAKVLIADVVGTAVETRVLRGGGNGYLKKKLPNFLEISRRNPVLVLTDLDLKQCAPGLLAEWLKGTAMTERMSIRVAVREIEAWLLADRENFGAFISQPPNQIPKNVEEIQHPKEFLLQLAKRAPRKLRSDLLRAEGQQVFQGLGYNDRLGEFVYSRWSIRGAEECSPSLRRAIADLAKLRTFLS